MKLSDTGKQESSERSMLVEASKDDSRPLQFLWRIMMKTKLVTIGIQSDDHDSDIEMFRVTKNIDLLIEPKLSHVIITEDGDKFFVEKIEQNLKEKEIVLYETLDVPHYEFWSDKKKFRQKYLTPFLKNGWIEI